MVSSGAAEGRNDANGPLQSGGGKCKKAAERKEEGGHRKSGKMKLYSSGNCCYGEEEKIAPCSTFTFANGRIFN